MRPFILCHRAADGDKEKSKKCTDEVQTCLRAHCKTEKRKLILLGKTKVT